jgi:threonine dehydratase
LIDLAAMEQTRRVLAPMVFHTPLVPSPHLSKLVGAEVWLKLENLQRTGSFKIRGAYARMHRLAQESPGAGVVAASAGNHAQGVAVSARMLGLEAVIYMPRGVSLAKREATAASGAEVRLVGESVADCLAAARRETPDLTLIHPYDDPEVILGQASIGLEILEDLPGVEAVVVPVGGGGLIGGVAAAIKSLAPAVLVMGVEPSRAASATAALAQGRPVKVETAPTLADGARIGQVGQFTLPLIQKYVDQVVGVGEEAISQAMLLLLERRRIVAEGAGALGLAAFLAGAAPSLAGRKVVLVVSGGNVDSHLLGRIINQGLARSGRILRLSVVLPDQPGSLAALLAEVASAQANVLHIHHDRLAKDLPPQESRLRLELETRGLEHAGEITALLAAKGYRLQPA